jgi:hypothetical protein
VRSLGGKPCKLVLSNRAPCTPNDQGRQPRASHLGFGRATPCCCTPVLCLAVGTSVAAAAPAAAAATAAAAVAALSSVSVIVLAVMTVTAATAAAVSAAGAALRTDRRGRYRSGPFRACAG